MGRRSGKHLQDKMMVFQQLKLVSAGTEKCVPAKKKMHPSMHAITVIC